jgi:hypothetical protein
VSAQDLSGDLVRFILRHDTTKKILREHAADVSGHCPRCPAGASSSGKVIAPCTLFLAAQAAEELGGSHRDR